MLKKWKHDRKSFHLSIVSMILWINLCGIIILTAFNYYVFQHKNGKAYQESFISYNQQITNLAFKNIDQQIMQAVPELPQLYFSPIDQNRSLLLPQTEFIGAYYGAFDENAEAAEKLSLSGRNRYLL